MRSLRWLTALTVLALVGVCINLAIAQDKDDDDEGFRNLQVFPKDISKGELMANMRKFSMELGVRCDHCHAPAQGENARGLDQSLDTKPEKLIAREMIKMTEAINAQFLAKLGEITDSSHIPQQVSCITCHHRDSEPRQLSTALHNAIAVGGADSARAEYAQLQEEYYGRAVYDFGIDELNYFAMDLFREGDTANALEMLELNREQFPDAWEVWEVIALIHAESGKIDEAKAAVNKGLELDPENRRLKRMLQQLEG